MSEFSEVREERVTTETSIECPICKELIELKLSVKIVINRSLPDYSASRVFMGLSNKEFFNVHTCWPKEEKP